MRVCSACWGAGRFDALSRSSSEVLQEFDLRAKDLAGVAVEKQLLLHYPMPACFWVPNTQDDSSL